MLLSAFSPSLLPNDLVTGLESLGISTTTDLLFSSASSLETYARLPSKIISFPEFEACIEAITDKLAAPGHSAAELGQRAHDDFRMETFPALDEQIDGGLPSGRVIEVSGDRNSGKSTLLLNWIMKTLLKDRALEVLWIDTTGDFSVERAIQILEGCQQNPDDLGQALERLHISTAVDIESIQEIIRALDVQFSGPDNSPRIKCIVIDSITPLLGVYLSAVSSQGHAIMTGLMRYLRHLATQYSLLVLVVNNSTLVSAPSNAGGQKQPAPNPYSAFASTIRKPALGPSFTFMTDATLWVSFWPEQQEREDGFTAHVVEVLRSKFSTPNVWSTFMIASNGNLLPNSTS